MAKKYVCLLIITGPAKSLDNFARRAKGFPAQYAGDRLQPLRQQALSFHSLIPVPQKQTDRRYTRRSKAGVADSGRDWEIAHWGCPRGAIQSAKRRRKGELNYMMLVHLSPPDTFIRASSAIFPKLLFSCYSGDPRTCTMVEAYFQAGRPIKLSR